MNQIEALARKVQAKLRDAQVELIRPRDRAGRWTLDVMYDDWLVVVVWTPRRGFGITARALEDEPEGLGLGPDEAYPGDDLDALARTVVRLLRDKRTTRPPRAVQLRELRERLQLTQAEVARRLKVSQGALSKQERRADMPLSQLIELIEVMGGELELWVRFPEDAPLRLLGKGDRS